MSLFRQTTQRCVDALQSLARRVSRYLDSVLVETTRDLTERYQTSVTGLSEAVLRVRRFLSVWDFAKMTCPKFYYMHVLTSVKMTFFQFFFFLNLSR